MLDVRVDGALGDDQPLGDLPVGQSLGHQAGDLPLAAGQPAGPGRRPGSLPPRRRLMAGVRREVVGVLGGELDDLRQRVRGALVPEREVALLAQRVAHRLLGVRVPLLDGGVAGEPAAHELPERVRRAEQPRRPGVPLLGDGQPCDAFQRVARAHGVADIVLHLQGGAEHLRAPRELALHQQAEALQREQVALLPPFLAAGAEPAEPAVAPGQPLLDLPGRHVQRAGLGVERDQHAGVAGGQGVLVGPDAGHRRLVVAAGEGERGAEVQVTAGAGANVLELLGDGDPLFQAGHPVPGLALQAGQVTGVDQRQRALAGRAPEQRQHPAQPVPALAGGAGHLPVHR